MENLRTIFASGNTDQIEGACRRALEVGANATAYQYLALLAYNKGDHELAIRYCTSAWELGVSSGPNFLVLGLSLSALGHDEKALQAYVISYNSMPDNMDAALHLLCTIKGVLGEEAAEKLYLEILPQMTSSAFSEAWKRFILTGENEASGEVSRDLYA